MMKYEVENKGYGSIWITVLGENAKKETMIIEIIPCKNTGGSNSLPNLWHKNGYTDKVMETYICCSTYVTDSEGSCRGAYDPTSKYDGKRNVINFDWLLEDTEENRQKIINECIRLFESATGKSATEIKEEKIIAYAKENNMQVLREIPEGWEVHHMCSCPIGTDRIANMTPFRNRKNPEYREALLIM